MNNLSDVCECSSPILFADDTISFIMGLIYLLLNIHSTRNLLQVVKSEQITIRYKKDSLYDIFSKEISLSTGFTNR